MPLPSPAPLVYITPMCGRVIQRSKPSELGLKIVDGLEDRDNRWSNFPPRYNAAPAQDLWIIRRNPATGERTLDLLRWGLVPHFCAEKPKPPPINAAAETLATKTFPPETRPFFADAYAKRRCIMPIDGFFEWKAVKGEKIRQPFAIAMKDGAPFGLAGLWENWKDPASGAWLRTFCIVTTRANALVRPIHSRMPVILAPQDYERWLAGEDDPRELLRPYPAEPMTMWPVSTRVNSYKNDDESLIAPALEADATAPPDGNSA
ncbi:MAG: SOS response-associated peptidase [Microvirga sp.]